jgi:plastocyanin
MNPVFVTSRRRLFQMGLSLIAAGSVIPIARGSANRHDATPGATPPHGGTATPAASPGATPATGESATVGMTNDLRFDPEEIVIGVGTTITWNNTTGMPHTATGYPDQNPVNKTHPEYIALPSGAEPWGSEMLQPGDSYEYTFTVPGEYRYICIPHVQSGMRGTIRVEE